MEKEQKHPLRIKGHRRRETAVMATRMQGNTQTEKLAVDAI